MCSGCLKPHLWSPSVKVFGCGCVHQIHTLNYLETLRLSSYIHIYHCRLSNALIMIIKSFLLSGK